MTIERESQPTTEQPLETVQEQLAREVKTCAIDGEGCKNLSKKLSEEAKRLGIPVDELIDQVFGLISKT